MKHCVTLQIWITLIAVGSPPFRNLRERRWRVTLTVPVSDLPNTFSFPPNLLLRGKRGNSNSSQIDNELRVFSLTPVCKYSFSNFTLNSLHGASIPWFSRVFNYITLISWLIDFECYAGVDTVIRSHVEADVACFLDYYTYNHGTVRVEATACGWCWVESQCISKAASCF